LAADNFANPGWILRTSAAEIKRLNKVLAEVN
jgi:hypothetical protein